MLKILATGTAIVAFASISLAAEAISSRGIYGNYMEARTADVYTGACVANGEAEQMGKEAVFGWKIDGGSWRGVSLAGLGVVGVIRSEHTLGLHTEPVNPAKAVLIVDSRANAEQRAALENFAKSMAGDLLKDVVQVETAPIELSIKNNSIHTATARLTAGKLAAVQTRAFREGDHVCGNEEVWYQPLTKLSHAMPAFTLENAYNGTGLGGTWNDRLKRSGFVGSFQASE